MLAIIKTGGKQYIVKEGDTIKIEKINAEISEKVTFDKVLLVSEEDGKALKTGTPNLDGIKVEATISNQGKGKKVNTVKYKNKTHYNRTKNHKQLFTEVIIDKIIA